MARHRVFLLGSARAEFEHVHGPLVVDDADPRFVLVDDETEELIRRFPKGVPPHTDQSWEDVKQIRAAELDIAGVDHDFGDGSASKEAAEKAGSGPVAQSSRAVNDGAPGVGVDAFNKGEAEKAAEKDAEADAAEAKAKPAAKSKAKK